MHLSLRPEEYRKHRTEEYKKQSRHVRRSIPKSVNIYHDRQDDSQDEIENALKIGSGRQFLESLQSVWIKTGE